MKHRLGAWKSSDSLVEANWVGTAGSAQTLDCSDLRSVRKERAGSMDSELIDVRYFVEFR